jgi:hydrogenase/urease accessory protein HupE
MSALVGILLFGLSSSVQADDIRPLYVEVEEIRDTTYALRMKVPPRVPTSAAPRIELPSDCVNQQGVLFACAEPLDGRSIGLVYPQGALGLSGVLKVEFRSGESHTLLVRPGDATLELPSREAGSSVAVDYTWMGMTHIWKGFDHLLFLLCLIWIAGTLKRILITVTGFTLAHSVTLALSALDVMVLPVPAVEAVIALSVLFLAVEVVKGRGRGERRSLTWEYPVVVSSSFGLLHGLGFAAVLSEIGLPQTEKVLGLVFFNVGVEIGQIAFAVAVVALLRLLPLMRRQQTIVGYAVGCTASFWLIGRIAAFAV